MDICEEFNRLSVSNAQEAVVLQHLQRFESGLDPSSLLGLVRTTKSLIAGSFIIDCVLGTNHAGDIDIFVPLESQTVWMSVLHEIAEEKVYYDKHSMYGDLPGITRHIRFAALNVMFCEDPSKVIQEFDLDLCQASYDGVQFLRCEQVSSKRMQILRPFPVYGKDMKGMNNWRIDRIIKYHQRGFKICGTQHLGEYIRQMGYIGQIFLPHGYEEREFTERFYVLMMHMANAPHMFEA